MRSLNEFSIPIRGISIGEHSFRFGALDADFFANFEDSLIKDASLQTTLWLDKRPDMLVLRFQYEGTVACQCDRCLEDFDLAIEDEQEVFVKYSEADIAEEAHVVYIPQGSTELNVARFLYEYATLSLPLRKVHPDLPDGTPGCNPDVMRYIVGSEDRPPAQEYSTDTDAEEGPQQTPFKDLLDKLKP